MIKAVITNGVIVPRDPLPENWREGTEVSVEKSACDSAAEDLHPTDAWMDEVEAIALQGDGDDDQRLDAALRDIGRHDK